MSSHSNKHIVIYDGVCVFCNRAVNFIIKRDNKNKFLFTPMQSNVAKELIATYQVKNVGIDTFLLIKSEKCYIWTSAALEIAKDLSGAWPLFNVFRIIPACIRDYFYRIFARNRYKLFGITLSCQIPSNPVRNKFLGLDSIKN